MAYSAIPKSSSYFNTKLWTGNATNGRAITGVGFQPDLAWIKNRSQTDNHALFDAIRGATYRIASNATTANTQATNSLASFDSDGFTLNDGGDANGNGENIVGWNWKANGQGSSNTDGSINTTYTSASTTSGFSICQYTGTGSAATVGHGLGAVPKMMLVKKTSGSESWGVYHHSIGNTKFLQLNATGAEGTSSAFWNNTTPTSSVFSIGTENGVNQSGQTYVAYCFAEKKGFSKFGSYTGNGNADGAFIYTGFKPAFIIVKASSISGNEWNIWDSKRNPLNVADKVLWANTSNTEAEIAYNYDIDMLSNGFKARTANARLNQNGATYIYMAFAEAPLVGSNNVPATAR